MPPPLSAVRPSEHSAVWLTATPVNTVTPVVWQLGPAVPRGAALKAECSTWKNPGAWPDLPGLQSQGRVVTLSGPVQCSSFPEAVTS